MDFDKFRLAFLKELSRTFPAWQPAIDRNLLDGTAIAISPPNWTGPPLRIDIEGDTVKQCPLCDFALDYIFTASDDDLVTTPDQVFQNLITDLRDFVSGRTVVAIKRRKFLILKVGWDVRFIPASQASLAGDPETSLIAYCG